MNQIEEEAYLANEYLILQTIRRQFPNHLRFAALHKLDLDDLKQFGGIGLIKAIRTYRSNMNMSFRTYAINMIKYNVHDLTKKYSLSNNNNQSYTLNGHISLETPKIDMEGNETTLYDTMVLNYSLEDEAIMEASLCKLTEVLPERTMKIVDLRLSGYTFAEIGREVNLSTQRVTQVINENREIISDTLLANSY